MHNDELREAQATLDAVRARYANLYDLAPVGYCTLSDTGLILEANQTIAKLFDVEREALTNLPLDRFIAESGHNSFLRHRKKLLASGHIQNFELQMATYGGSPFWAHLLASAARDPDGTPVIHLVVSDITERRQAEAQLHRNEAFNLAILDSVSAEIAVLDRNGIIIAANQPWQQFSIRHEFRTSSSPPLTKIGGNFVEACRKLEKHHPDAPANVSGPVLAVLNGQSPEFSFEYLCPSRQRQWFSIRISPMGDGAVITHTNISTLKQAEQHEQFRSRLLEQLALDEPLASLLKALVVGLEELNPSMLCSILLLDEEGKHLHGGIAPSLPNFYNDAINGVEIGPGVGSCGTAAFTGERVIVENIATHPYWAPYKELAAKAGLASCWSQPILSATGNVLGTYAIYHREPHSPTATDINIIEQAAHIASIAIERHHVIDQLRENEERWQFALEGSGEGVWDWNIQTGEAVYSKRWKEMFGFAEDEMGATSAEWSSRIHPDDLPKVMAAVQAHVEGNSPSIVTEYRMRCKDDRWLWTVGRGMVVSRSSDGRALRLVGTNTDISERKRMEEEIRHLAFYDTLTDLPNRRLLNDRLTLTMATSARSGNYGAVLFLDLDNFKPLNDLHGHEAGDLLLIEASARLKHCVREIDTVARFGGDELVVVIGELHTDKAPSKKQALLIAEKIRQSMSEPYRLPLKRDANPEAFVDYRCTVSIGIVLFVNHKTPHGDILKWADMAMYKAKEAGRNQIRFFDTDTNTFE